MNYKNRYNLYIKVLISGIFVFLGHIVNAAFDNESLIVPSDFYKPVGENGEILTGTYNEGFVVPGRETGRMSFVIPPGVDRFYVSDMNVNSWSCGGAGACYYGHSMSWYDSSYSYALKSSDKYEVYFVFDEAIYDAVSTYPTESKKTGYFILHNGTDYEWKASSITLSMRINDKDAYMDWINAGGIFSDLDEFSSNYEESIVGSKCEVEFGYKSFWGNIGISELPMSLGSDESLYSRWDHLGANEAFNSMSILQPGEEYTYSVEIPSGVKSLSVGTTGDDWSGIESGISSVSGPGQIANSDHPNIQDGLPLSGNLYSGVPLKSNEMAVATFTLKNNSDHVFNLFSLMFSMETGDTQEDVDNYNDWVNDGNCESRSESEDEIDDSENEIDDSEDEIEDPFDSFESSGSFDGSGACGDTIGYGHPDFIYGRDPLVSDNMNQYGFQKGSGVFSQVPRLACENGLVIDAYKLLDLGAYKILKGDKERVSILVPPGLNEVAIKLVFVDDSVTSFSQSGAKLASDKYYYIYNNSPQSDTHYVNLYIDNSKNNKSHSFYAQMFIRANGSADKFSNWCGNSLAIPTYEDPNQIPFKFPTGIFEGVFDGFEFKVDITTDNKDFYLQLLPEGVCAGQ